MAGAPAQQYAGGGERGDRNESNTEVSDTNLPVEGTPLNFPAVKYERTQEGLLARSR